MCLEDCFSCQQPCWPRDDLLPADSSPAAGFPSHSQKHFSNKPPLLSEGGDSQPEGVLQAYSSHYEDERSDDHQPVDGKKPDQHEKQARRETVMGYLLGGMPDNNGSMPEDDSSGISSYEKRWYAVGD